MKNLVFSIAAACIICTSCSKQEESRPCVQHYIPTYVKGEYVLSPLYANKGISLSLNNVKLLSSPDKYPGIKAEEYLSIAERNGDMSYNRPADYDWDFRMAYADNFRSLHLTSDTDWDETHPAGTPLDDLIRIEASSYAAYILNGYQGDEKNIIAKRLDQIAPDELQVVHFHGFYTNPDFYFLTDPVTHGPHTLTLTITTTDGKVHTPTVTCIPKPYDPETE